MGTSVESEDLRDELSSLPDGELARIAKASTEEYRPEAIALARELLRNRGHDADDVAFVREAAAEAEREKDERDAALSEFTDRVSTAAYPWPAWLLMAAGFAVLGLALPGVKDRGPNENVYLMTMAMLLLGASEYEVLRTWKQRARLTKIHSLKFLVPAAMFAAWSLLLVLGVVHY